MSTIRTYIDQRAEIQPDEVFLIAPEIARELRCAELQSKVRDLGKRLFGLGLSKGGKVAFLLDNGYWSTNLFLGTMYNGLVIVPLNAVAGAEQLGYVLEHSDSEVLFISERYLEKIEPTLNTLSRSVRVIQVDEDSEPWSPEVVTGDLAELP